MATGSALVALIWRSARSPVRISIRLSDGCAAATGGCLEGVPGFF
jgi:hypothetical protein